MVIGIEKFREYFKDYPGSYIIIGGTALDMVISEAGLTPRRTDDIDIVLVVHALKKDFLERFWQFIKDGGYGKQEINEEEKKYYRFENPKEEGFPIKLELFSKEPESITVPEGFHLTPVPVEEGLSNLSAILMDDDYYEFTLNNCNPEEEVNRANKEALVCLKAKAYLENKRLKEEGKKIQTRDVVKHKYDVFRLTLLFAPADEVDVPEALKQDLRKFVTEVENDLPPADIFKIMQVGAKVDVPALFQQFKTNFKLE